VSSDCVQGRLPIIYMHGYMSVTITRVNCPVIRKNIAKRYKHISERYNVVVTDESLSHVYAMAGM
jgi:hypothetical protein